MKPTTPSRRQFLKQSAIASASAWIARSSWAQGSPNGKLNVGCIGTANRAGADLAEVAKEKDTVNLVALCDVDDRYLAAAKDKHPDAKTYHDFRRLLEQKDIDAVVIGTPDHCHAVITVAALQSGRHVYCEKPLTHTISEARIVAEMTKKSGRVTQMGNQIHATNNYRRVVELVQSGAIGPVHEVHHWVANRWEPMAKPAGSPVPPQLHYDLWLGPVKETPYSEEYVPHKWRRWWHFGGGTLADFCCHHIDLSKWALGYGLPVAVEVMPGSSSQHPDCAPLNLVVKYDFGARQGQPPVKLFWHHGDMHPPQLADAKFDKWRSGSLFIGSKGMLLADYSKHLLLPEADFAGFKATVPSIPNSIGHHKEWIEACRGNGRTTSHFGYGAELTETGLLGNLAHRVGQKIIWDAKKMKAVGCPQADQFIQHEYRSGWKI